MTEAEWFACVDVEQLLIMLRDGSGGVKLHFMLSKARVERAQRLFLIACCRAVWHRMPDASSCRAVDVAEEYADNRVNQVRLKTANVAAQVVCRRVTADTNYTGYCAACAAAEASETDFGIGFHRCINGSLLTIGAFTDHRARVGVTARDEARSIATGQQAAFLHDIFGNPFRPVTFAPAWRTNTALSLAQGMYESRDFSAMPILADALQDAGCDSEDILNHCRDPKGTHVRGCRVVDLVLGKG